MPPSGSAKETELMETQGQISNPIKKFVEKHQSWGETSDAVAIIVVLLSSFVVVKSDFFKIVATLEENIPLWLVRFRL